MRRGSMNFKVMMLFLVFWFIVIPMGVSLFYGNIPFITRSYYGSNYSNGYGTYSNSGNYVNSSNSYIPNNSYGYNNINGYNMNSYGYSPKYNNYSNSYGPLGSYSSSYLISRQMTFGHVFRDMLVLFIVAIIAILLYQLFGNRFFRSLRRRL